MFFLYLLSFQGDYYLYIINKKLKYKSITSIVKLVLNTFCFTLEYQLFVFGFAQVKKIDHSNKEIQFVNSL